MDGTIYKYQGKELPNPGPEFSPDEVKQMYVSDYPGLLNAAASVDETGGQTVVTFEERMKKKG